MLRSTAVACSLLVLSACSSAGSPAPSQEDSTPPASASQTPLQSPGPPEPSSNANVLSVPLLVGMPWGAAQGQAASAGFALEPTFTGPLTEMCRVTGQNPPPNERVDVPRISVLVDCPSSSPGP